MAITHLLNKSVVIKRLQNTSNDRMAMSTVTSAMTHIQPLTESSRQIEDGVFGKQFKIFMDLGANVRVGDRLIDSDGNHYTVVGEGVTSRSFGSIDFVMLVAEKTLG